MAAALTNEEEEALLRIREDISLLAQMENMSLKKDLEVTQEALQESIEHQIKLHESIDKQIERHKVLKKPSPSSQPVDFDFQLTDVESKEGYPPLESTVSRWAEVENPFEQLQSAIDAMNDAGKFGRDERYLFLLEGVGEILKRHERLYNVAEQHIASARAERDQLAEQLAAAHSYIQRFCTYRERVETPDSD